MTEIRQTHKNTVYSPLHGGTKTTTSNATEGDGRVSSAAMQCSDKLSFNFLLSKSEDTCQYNFNDFATTLKLTFMRETEHLSV